MNKHFIFLFFYFFIFLFFYFFIFLFLIITCIPSFAGETVCNGVIERVMTFNDGRVATRLVDTQKVYVLCDQTYAGCSAVLSNLLSNEVQKKRVDLIFRDTTYETCEDIPNWANMSTDFNYMRSLPQ